MNGTIEEYQTKPKALTGLEMEQLHKELLSEIGSDADGQELYEELLETAVRYAAIRAGWSLLSPKERTEQDPGRTSCHNSVITYLNMLARYERQQGKEAAWREQLGYEEDDPNNRKAMGDFACYLAFVNALLAR